MGINIKNNLNALFIYTKRIGKCIITAEMDLRDVSSVYKYISKTNDEGNNLPVMPMIAMFKNTVEEVLETYSEEMIRHLDSESDDDWHSPTITIYPNEKLTHILVFLRIYLMRIFTVGILMKVPMVQYMLKVEKLQ